MSIKQTKPAQKPTLTSLERAVKCAELAYDKKAYDIRAIDISRISTIADYLVIASGSSDRQVQAIADSIRIGLKKYGKVNDIEGESESKWIVMDYGDVLVHVFHEPLRSYYDLDGLWNAAPQVELAKEIRESSKPGDY
jgi:ribosome-associated protein